MNTKKMKICPICKKVYIGFPALSRLDNRTLICSECGQRQALESIGIVGEEQDHIVNISRRAVDEKNYSKR